ncbi:MAG TPA: hypothetical protein V6C90_04765 [Coleofasciculaceae cyanobacterium]|jgi:hypothetical protein
MTYATIKATKEVLETVELSRSDRNQQRHIFYDLFKKLGNYNKARKVC